MSKLPCQAVPIYPYELKMPTMHRHFNHTTTKTYWEWMGGNLGCSWNILKQNHQRSWKLHSYPTKQRTKLPLRKSNYVVLMFAFPFFWGFREMIPDILSLKRFLCTWREIDDLVFSTHWRLHREGSQNPFKMLYVYNYKKKNEKFPKTLGKKRFQFIWFHIYQLTHSLYIQI